MVVVAVAVVAVVVVERGQESDTSEATKTNLWDVSLERNMESHSASYDQGSVVSNTSTSVLN